MKNLITPLAFRRILIRCAVAALLAIPALRSYCFILAFPPNDLTCVNPVIFLPQAAYNDLSNVNVTVEIQYALPPALPFTPVTACTMTVPITNLSYFQPLGSMTFDGNTLYGYRYVYTGCVLPPNSLENINLTVTDGSSGTVFYTSSLSKTCAPCPTCASRWEYNNFYNNLSQYILDEDPFTNPIYNGPYPTLPAVAVAELANAMNWLLNASYSISDYMNILDPTQIGNSVTPAPFCNNNAYNDTCPCRQNMAALLQWANNKLVAAGAPVGGIPIMYTPVGQEIADTFEFYCQCLGNYWPFLYQDVGAGTYTLIMYPYEGGLPSFSTQVVFDGTNVYQTIASSYYWTTEIDPGIAYMGGGQFNYYNGFTSIIQSPTFGDCPGEYLGYGAVSREDREGTQGTLVLFPLQDPTPRDQMPTYGGPGNNWGLPINPCPGWAADTLGQIFGVTWGTADTPFLFASVTQAYPQNTFATYASGFQDFPDPTTGNGGHCADQTPLIWKLDYNTCSYTPLIVSSTLLSVKGDLNSNTGNLAFNRGAGMGNLCFDRKHNQIFATNMEDGRIYRIDAASGVVLSRYDYPNNLYNAGTGTDPVVVDTPYRLWGIAYNQPQNTLYFSVWKESYGFQSSDANEIRSIPLTTTGDFNAPFVGTSYDHADGGYGSSRAFLVPPMGPPFASSPLGYSNPVSDIKFSSDGNSMMIAERCMGASDGSHYWLPGVGPFYASVGYYACYGYAHQGRALRYDYSSGVWTASVDSYFVGNFTLPYVGVGCGSLPADYTNANSAGGVDFNYDPNDSLPSDTCDQVVWMTGDALKFEDCNPTWSTSEYVYGIQGTYFAPGNTYNTCGVDPTTLKSVAYSFFQDIWSDPDPVSSNKNKVGDIAIMRYPCSICSQIVGTSVLQITPAGDLIDTFRNVGRLTPDYIKWTIDGVPVAQTAGNLPFVDTLTNLLPGNHIICMNAAYILPGTGVDNLCCYDQVCDTIYIDSCSYWRGTDSIIAVKDTNNWAHVIFDYYGHHPSYLTIVWNFGDGSNSIVTNGDTSHVYADTGTYQVCAIIIWSEEPVIWSPDSAGVCCCADTICFYVHVIPCGDRSFNISYSPTATGYNFGLNSNGPITSYLNVTWTIDGTVPSGGMTGATPAYGYAGSLTGKHVICVTFQYSPTYTDGSSYECDGSICDTIDFGGDMPDFFHYYPNPADNQFTVEANARQGDQLTVKITDYLGRAVFERTLQGLPAGNSYLVIDTHNWTNGVYTMSVTLGPLYKTVKVEKQ